MSTTTLIGILSGVGGALAVGVLFFIVTMWMREAYRGQLVEKNVTRDVTAKLEVATDQRDQALGKAATAEKRATEAEKRSAADRSVAIAAREEFIDHVRKTIVSADTDDAVGIVDGLLARRLPGTDAAAAAPAGGDHGNG